MRGSSSPPAFKDNGLGATRTFRESRRPLATSSRSSTILRAAAERLREQGGYPGGPPAHPSQLWGEEGNGLRCLLHYDLPTDFACFRTSVLSTVFQKDHTDAVLKVPTGAALELWGPLAQPLHRKCASDKEDSRLDSMSLRRTLLESLGCFVCQPLTATIHNASL